jgi:hypothetical protein
MAKSSRASSTKTNNQRLKKQVFGPVESARTERLSAKLLELAAQPKPIHAEKEKEMEGVEEGELPPLSTVDSSVYCESQPADLLLQILQPAKRLRLLRRMRRVSANLSYSACPCYLPMEYTVDLLTRSSHGYRLGRKGRKQKDNSRKEKD